MASQDNRPTTNGSNQPQVPRGSEPVSYYRDKINIGQKVRVGPHKKEAFSTARVYNHRSGNTRMHVHDGPMTKSTRLATIETLSLRKQSLLKGLFIASGARRGVPDDIDIILHPDQFPGKSRSQARRIEIRSRDFTFTAPLAGGRHEAFTWRWSDGGEVGHYTRRIPGVKGDGWKLLRLETEGQDGSRDGKECVAAFAKTNKLFVTKEYRYQLFNSGASGSLGGDFETYAYLTFLAILDQEAREAAKAAADRQAENARRNQNVRYHNM